MQTIATGFDSVVAIPTYNNQTGTSYTFVLADTGKTVTSNNASAVTFTIPPQSSVAWTANTSLRVTNLGAGALSIAGGVGVTVTNNAITIPQYGSATIIRTAENAWTEVPNGTATGLVQIVPTSIVKGASGTASVATGGKVTFSGTESISLNGVFTSTYDNYLIKIDTITSVNATEHLVRLRTSGTDNSNSSYVRNYLRAAGASVAGGTDTQNRFSLGDTSNANRNKVELLLNQPQQTAVTTGYTFGNHSAYAFNASLLFSATTSFDAFSYFPASGTITGDITVYAYSKGA
jgi:hypothetical protein